MMKTTWMPRVLLAIAWVMLLDPQIGFVNSLSHPFQPRSSMSICERKEVQ